MSNTRVALSDLLWSEISEIELPDGSNPPLLSSVIDSLSSSTMTFYVELKSQESAALLAQTLKHDPRLLLQMRLIFISFCLNSLNILRQAFQLQPAVQLRLLWLVDNPCIPYPPESLDEGELTFDICRCSFEEFLDANDLRELFLEVSPEGLGIQFVKD